MFRNLSDEVGHGTSYEWENKEVIKNLFGNLVARYRLGDINFGGRVIMLCKNPAALIDHFIYYVHKYECYNIVFQHPVAFVIIHVSLFTICNATIVMQDFNDTFF
jgi:hypothetical protein